MSKIAVIYKSKNGTTKRYAEWIAEALDASIFEASDVKPTQLADYDVIVYGGWVFASKISGVKLVTEHACKALVVFSVGLADPKISDYTELLAENFKPEFPERIKVFHLRGGIDYKKMGFVQRGMMSLVKKSAEKKEPDKRTGEEQAVLETFDGTFDFTERAAIEPLVAYVRLL